MLIFNTQDRYGIINILLHWIMAILVLGMIALGWYMSDLPVSLQKLKLFGLHKEFGVLVFMLIILRLFWRLINQTPRLPSQIPWIQRLAARIVHWIFYVLLILIPISGWLMSSAAGLSVSFFGLFTLPNIIDANKETMEQFLIVHSWLAYTLLVVIILHAAAALKHHFIDKDDILRRMLS